VVVPPERRVTQQTAGNGAADNGFAPRDRRTSLLALRMISDIRRGSRLADGPVDAKCGLRGTLR